MGTRRTGHRRSLVALFPEAVESMLHRTYREQVFRVDRRRSFWVLFCCLCVVGLAMAGVAHVVWDRPFYPLWDGIVAPLLYAGLLYVALAYLRARLTVTVMPEGLRSFDAWGRYRVLAWRDIAAASRWSFFGLPSARVSGGSLRWPLWVPLTLEHRDELSELVASYTEPENPFRQLLQTRGRRFRRAGDAAPQAGPVPKPGPAPRDQLTGWPPPDRSVASRTNRQISPASES